jgi:hypothetical protein
LDGHEAGGICERAADLLGHARTCGAFGTFGKGGSGDRDRSVLESWREGSDFRGWRSLARSCKQGFLE